MKQWLCIARTEFQVQTSSFRKRRFSVITGLFGIGFVWALFIAPLLMDLLLNEVLGISGQTLSLVMPSIIRSGMMFIWLILLLFPLSNALKEIKIGQWEILLSNNVSARAIFTGSFLGKLPVNGLLLLFR